MSFEFNPVKFEVKCQGTTKTFDNLHVLMCVSWDYEVFTWLIIFFKGIRLILVRLGGHMSKMFES